MDKEPANAFERPKAKALKLVISAAILFSAVAFAQSQQIPQQNLPPPRPAKQRFFIAP
jgi:hypothetical protein